MISGRRLLKFHPWVSNSLALLTINSRSLPPTPKRDRGKPFINELDNVFNSYVIVHDSLVVQVFTWFFLYRNYVEKMFLSVSKITHLNTQVINAFSRESRYFCLFSMFTFVTRMFVLHVQVCVTRRDLGTFLGFFLSEIIVVVHYFFFGTDELFGDRSGLFMCI